MCRHVGWLGEPRTVADVLLDPVHGLVQQSFAPRRQAHGRVNADGWGIGLFPAGGSPVRWRSTRPIWQDQNLASIAPLLSSACVLGAVRSATPGMPVEEGATAPFTDGTWLLSHNGRVDRSVLPVGAAGAGGAGAGVAGAGGAGAGGAGEGGAGAGGAAESSCDAALLAAHVFARGAGSLGATVREVGRADPAARLNLLAADGATVLATTWGDTLSYLLRPDGLVVASEPTDDDPGWVDLPDRTLLRGRWDGTSAHVELTSLEDP